MKRTLGIVAVVVFSVVLVPTALAAKTHVGNASALGRALYVVKAHTATAGSPCYVRGTVGETSNGLEDTWLYLDQTLWCAAPSQIASAYVSQTFTLTASGTHWSSNSGWGALGAPQSTGQNRYTDLNLSYVPYGAVFWQRTISAVTNPPWVWSNTDPSECTVTRSGSQLTCNYGEYGSLPGRLKGW